MKRKFTKLIAAFALLVFMMPSLVAWGQTWELATSIQAGDVVVLVTKYDKMELKGISSTSTKYGIGAAYQTVPAATYPLTVVAGASEGSFAFKNGNNYLSWTSGNSLNVNSTLNANTSWTVSIDGTDATITNMEDATRQIWWNVSSPRFACYTGKEHGDSYHIVSLYKQVVNVNAVANPSFSPADGDYYTAQNVELDCTTPGATIHYSTTSNEGPWMDYSQAIPVSTTTTIWAYATATNYDPSDVVSATYNILPTTFNQDWEGATNGWTFVNVSGEQVWSVAATNGNHYAKMSGYASSANHENEDWCISPAFDLSEYSNPVLTFKTAKNYTGNDLVVYFSNNYDGQNLATATWQELVCTLSPGGSWTFVESGNIDMSSFSGSECYIGFKYTSTTSAAATWELDDIVLASQAITPTITLSPSSINVGENNAAGEEISATFTVSQLNLTAGITLSLEGNGDIDITSIAKGAEPTTVTWTYTPTEAGNINATITATSAGAEAQTLTIMGAAFIPVSGYSIDFENEASLYTDWTFTNMTSKQTGNSNVNAHGGTYYGTTGGKATASISTKNAVATPYSLTCFVTKQTDNNTPSTWSVQVSANGEDWTDVGSTSAADMAKGEWKEFSVDLSAYTNVYVRVYYSGSTAVRNIDDLTLSTEAPAVLAPTFSPVAGTYTEIQNVTITCATEGATIYYTTDGTMPTDESNEYTEAITVAESTTIKAIAYNAGGQFSTVATAEYIINLPTVATPTFTPAAGTYTSAQTVSIVCETEGASIFYRLTENGEWQTYSQALTISETTTVWAKATKTGMSDSEVASATYTIVAPFEPATYTLATSIESGKTYIITDGIERAMGVQNGSVRSAADVTIKESTATVNTADVYEFVISGNETDGYTIFDSKASGYLYASSSSSNNIGTRTENSDANSMWAIVSGDENGVTITAKGGNTRNSLRYNYNQGNDRFSCYGSNSNLDATLYLFVKEETPTGPSITVTGYGDTDGGYVLLAWPENISPDNIDGMISDNYGAQLTPETPGTYDLYYYDESQEKEWRNYRTNSFNLVPGKGYLYASKEGVTLTYEGEADPVFTDVDNLPYTENDLVKSIYLAGNSKTNEQTFYVYNSELAKQTFNYLTMNEDGDGFISGQGAAYTAPAMTGFFVQAPGAGMTLSTTDVNAKANASLLNINVLRSRGSVIDNAIVSFSNGSMMDKFYLKNNTTRVYIPQGNREMAIANSAAEAEMPVSFRASENGTYTLAVEAENVEMNYLHLIDNLTGADVDLLATPSYSFEANTRDYANRFKLVFKANTGMEENTATETFAYFNGTNWTVSNVGDATLQVVDMMGRVLSSQTLSGNANVNINQAAGIYMLRLVNGENVMVQKVVVR